MSGSSISREFSILNRTHLLSELSFIFNFLNPIFFLHFFIKRNTYYISKFYSVTEIDSTSTIIQLFIQQLNFFIRHTHQHKLSLYLNN